MSIVQSFLEKVNLSGKEGKIVTDWPKIDVAVDSRAKSSRHATLRYVLLQPSVCFQDLLTEAHALALVGGTLRPFVHVGAELLGSDHSSVLEQALQADERVQQQNTGGSVSVVTPAFSAFTCDHVVPSSNVLLQLWSQGATGSDLDFRHQSRSSNSMIDELGQSLLRLMEKVPSGLVVFLPSYSYEAQLIRRWKSTGLWAKMDTIKRLYREPKRSQQVEPTLQAYAHDASKGAALFSVVGGKLSEGINFANDMARCVAVVGLPFPDCTDSELKEKMNLKDMSGGPVTGNAYYLNLCLRAVNQSVGRAIRHAKDYAAICLLDKRYTTDRRIQSGLPSWLTRGRTHCLGKSLSFQQHMDGLERFFDRRTPHGS